MENSNINKILSIMAAILLFFCLSISLTSCTEKRTEPNRLFLPDTIYITEPQSSMLIPKLETIAPPTETLTPTEEITEPDAKTNPPQTEAKAPAATEKLPAETTKTPAATTKAPAATTKAPAATTKAPAATTKAPAATTKAPAATTKAPAATTKAPAATTKVPSGTDNAPNSTVSDIEREVVRLVNIERAANGLAALTLNEDLSAVARLKAEDMSKNNYFSHTSPTYGSPFDMIKKFGISYRTAGENIAKGQTTAKQVVDAWMNSEGHRANILSPSFTQIGIGYYANGSYWAQMFIG